MRFAAGIEYEGTRYSGWQIQPHAPSVQGEVQRALSAIADNPVSVTCAGRTDAGVHAFGQVVHFDTSAERPMDGWLFGTNALLPQDISLRWIKPVPEDFHARFSARARRYRYVIHNSRARSGIHARHALWFTSPLEHERMNEAGQQLLGEHDFSAFRAAECQARSPMRCVTEIVVRRKADFVLVEVEANAFLHHMVRNIVGVLLAIGQGRQAVGWAGEVLQGRNRGRGGVTAGPEGLHFLFARYDSRYAIPLSPA